MIREIKKSRKSSPIGFCNFSVKYERRGVNLSKWGVQIAIFIISNLVLPEYFGSGVTYGGSNLLPPFPINRRREAIPNILNPLAMHFQLFWVKKIVFVKKIQAEMLP